MLYALKDKMRRVRFAGACKGVLRTAPVSLAIESDLVLLSQLQHKDVLMFLLAVKSFARRVRPHAIYVLNDGSLTADDRAALREHIPGVTVFELAEFRSSACPSGGTRERLLAISSLVRDHYVIQLDSDTLTIGAIVEVRDCIESQAAFTIGTWDKQKLETMHERCETATKLAPQVAKYFQCVAGAPLKRLRDFGLPHHVRGWSGLAGYAR